HEEAVNDLLVFAKVSVVGLVILLVVGNLLVLLVGMLRNKWHRGVPQFQPQPEHITTASDSLTEPVVRPDWDAYFLGIAEAASRRSDCERRKVGAAVVKDRRVRGTGYNGAPSGEPGCESCPRRLSDVPPGSSYDTGPGTCVAIHAEGNALLYCDREDLVGATLYVTAEPCAGCRKLIRASGVVRVVWPDGELTF